MDEPPNLRLQRGGFYGGVEAVKKWSKHRREVERRMDAAVAATVEAVADLRAAASGAFGFDAGMEALDRAVDHVDEYRFCVQERLRLVDVSQQMANPSRRQRRMQEGIDCGEREMTLDDVSALVAGSVEAADGALEAFKASIETLRAQIKEASAAEASETKPLRAELRKAATRLRGAVKDENRAAEALLAHARKGEGRLYRSRHDLERCSGPALVFLEGCRLTDGTLTLPGGLDIPMPAHVRDFSDVAAASGNPDLEWAGAVHLVDVTDIAGRVTARTRPKHRKYRLHFLCTATAQAPQAPESPEHVLGTDWGVAIPLACSDGTTYDRHPDEQARQASRRRHQQVQALQQSMSNKTVGSNRYNKQRRRKHRLQARTPTCGPTTSSTPPKTSPPSPTCAS